MLVEGITLNEIHSLIFICSLCCSTKNCTWSGLYLEVIFICSLCCSTNDVHILGLQCEVTGVSDGQIPQDKPNPLSHSYTVVLFIVPLFTTISDNIHQTQRLQSQTFRQRTIYLSVANNSLHCTLSLSCNKCSNTFFFSSYSCLCNCYAQSILYLSLSPGVVIHSVIRYLLVNLFSVNHGVHKDAHLLYSVFPSNSK